MDIVNGDIVLTVEIRTEDLEYEKDEVMGAECEDCGKYVDLDSSDDEDDIGYCPECEGYMLLQTYHEGQKCPFCGDTIEMWEDGYRYIGHDARLGVLREELICLDCGKKLTESD